MSTLGERIKERRRVLGYTRTQLAEKIGVIPNSLYRWESGQRVPGDEDKKRLAEILGVSVAYLIGESESPQTNVDLTSAKNVVAIPLLDPTAIACAGCGNGGLEGIMLEASESILVPVDELGVIGEHRPYAIRVEGDSMVEAGIPDGARIAINPEEEVFNGDAVLVKWGRRGDVAVKWFYEYEDRIELRSSNPAKYPPIVISKKEIAAENEAGNTDYFRICGKVMIVSMKPKRGI
jgi:SOS-response transcriptional repressor LexA